MQFSNAYLFYYDCQPQSLCATVSPHYGPMWLTPCLSGGTLAETSLKTW